MSDWIHALPLGWMGLVVFGGTLSAFLKVVGDLIDSAS